MTAAKLYLVGTGPGASDLLAPRARKALEGSSDIVGYGLYFDLLELDLSDKSLHEFKLGEEIQRARHAIELALGGSVTSLVSSGDIGIYAMATLVFELLDQHVQKSNTAKIPEIEVIPGISALQANASNSGAILGHDFCTISLSDLLTPWETIVQRLHAAGSGDFVVSFYNPVSVKRNWQLDTARDILLEYRPGAHPARRSV